MAWENSENLDFPWKYHKYPHIFCPASLVKFGEKWDTLLLIHYKDTPEYENVTEAGSSDPEAGIGTVKP